MHIAFLTQVLDGWPWLQWHFPVFKAAGEKYGFTWDWCVTEGTALPFYCSSHLTLTPIHHSTDDTLPYLNTLTLDSRVHLDSRRGWNGKIEMLRASAAMAPITTSVFWEVDVDELWTVEGIGRALTALETAPVVHVHFNHFVGKNLVTGPAVPGANYWGKSPDGWPRIWRTVPEASFTRYSTPVYGPPDRPFAVISDVDHCGYVLESQVAAKAAGYRDRECFPGIVESWRKLQGLKFTNPVPAVEYFPWVKDDTLVFNFRETVGASLL